MNTFEAIRTKRSVRQFTGELVPEEIIHQILDAGRHAQSSKNEQPWTFIVVRDKERLKALSECGNYVRHVAEAAFAIVLVDHSNWSFDIGQAAAYLQLAGWELGVGSCLAYFGEQDRLKALLGIPESETVEMGISFGYPAERPHKPGKFGRKPLEEIVRWEGW